MNSWPGFRSGCHVHGDTGLGGGAGHGLTGVVFVYPYVADGGGDSFCLARQLGNAARSWTVGQVVVPQEERITPPQGRHRPVGPASPPCRQCSAAFPASGIGRAGHNSRPARHRQPERGWNAGPPPPPQRHLRCQLVRVRPNAGLQTGVASRPVHRSRPLVSLSPPVSPMRGSHQCDDAGGSSVHLRCGHSADRDTNAAVNLARWGQIPGPPSRRPGHQSPPTGRL